ncbi:ABC transporter permease [Rhizobium wenxiniae]|uniref:ABC transporter permease n=1 Tax=Rhizobium wenxiniae TaxID=1737357 RepID=UPI001C6F0B13|nr:ABC transporter permease [Rhizobium wenxiniae]MBW9090824.1 ABC transporter permease [Rhizobium wenxiniae]
MYYLTTHFRIVSAFVIREVATRYGRSPGGYVWAFLEPIAFITIMSLLMSAIGRVPPVGESFTLFYATGYLAFSMYKAMESYLVSAVSANKSLLGYPNVSAFDAVVGRLLLQIGTATVVAAVIIGGIMVTLRHPPSIDWVKIIEATSLAWILAIGMALGNITLFFYFPIYKKVYETVTRPLFLLSGVFLMPTHLPHPFREWMLLNPVTHIVILFREGFYGGAGLDGLDMNYLIATSTTILFVGMFIFTYWPVARLRD